MIGLKVTRWKVFKLNYSEINLKPKDDVIGCASYFVSDLEEPQAQEGFWGFVFIVYCTTNCQITYFWEF